MTDVVMPGLSGRHLADRLSTLRPGIRVLCGYSGGITTGAGLARGLPLLSKPYPPAELLYVGKDRPTHIDSIRQLAGSRTTFRDRRNYPPEAHNSP
jgi:hypothetical protein